MFAVNVESMFLTTQAFTPAVTASGRGRIVNMTSVSTALVITDSTPYVASKMAVIGLTRGTATELAGSGTTVNAVAPSVVATPGTADVPDEAFAAFAQTQAIKRVSSPTTSSGRWPSWSPTTRRSSPARPSTSTAAWSGPAETAPTVPEHHPRDDPHPHDEEHEMDGTTSSTLWTPTRVGRLDLAHRLAMAPMTRSRATPQGVPTEQNARYYASGPRSA